MALPDRGSLGREVPLGDAARALLLAAYVGHTGRRRRRHDRHRCTHRVRVQGASFRLGRGRARVRRQGPHGVPPDTTRRGLLARVAVLRRRRRSRGAARRHQRRTRHVCGRTDGAETQQHQDDGVRRGGRRARGLSGKCASGSAHRHGVHQPQGDQHQSHGLGRRTRLGGVGVGDLLDPRWPEARYALSVCRVHQRERNRPPARARHWSSRGSLGSCLRRSDGQDTSEAEGPARRSLLSQLSRAARSWRSPRL